MDFHVLPQQLDQQRLIDNAALILTDNSDSIPVGGGKTVAYLYLLLGQAQLSDHAMHFAYVCSRTFLADAACDDFYDLLTENDIAVERLSTYMLWLPESQKMFDFMSTRTFIDHWYPSPETKLVYVDVTYMNVHREFCMRMNDYYRTLDRIRNQGIRIL